MTTTDPAVEPPVIPDGDALYAQIMGGIEPDLVPGTIGALKEKYAGETPEQAKARAARYERAFAEYDQQYAAYMQETEAKVRTYEHAAIASVEYDDRADEDAQMQDLESAISSS